MHQGINMVILHTSQHSLFHFPTVATSDRCLGRTLYVVIRSIRWKSSCISLISRFPSSAAPSTTQHQVPQAAGGGQEVWVSALSPVLPALPLPCWKPDTFLARKILPGLAYWAPFQPRGDPDKLTRKAGHLAKWSSFPERQADVWQRPPCCLSARADPETRW